MASWHLMNRRKLSTAIGAAVLSCLGGVSFGVLADVKGRADQNTEELVREQFRHYDPDVAKKIRSHMPLERLKEYLHVNGVIPIGYARVAAMSGRVDVIEYILSSPEYDFSSAEIDYLFLRSVISGNLDAVDALLSVGANPNAKNSVGAGAIEIALHTEKSAHLVPKLIEYGVKPELDVLSRLQRAENVRENIEGKSAVLHIY